MKFLPFALFFLSLQLSVATQAQVSAYIGVSGGSGFPREVLFHGAIPLEIGLKDNFSIQAEIGYIQRENPNALGVLPRGRNYFQPVINYLELPVLAKFRLPFEFVEFFFVAGPQVAYGVGLRSTYEEDKMVRVEKLDFEETGLSRFDFGLNIGGGLEKEITQGRRIFVEFRLYLGLYNINAGGEEDIFNQGKEFSIGFLIPVKDRKPE